MRPLRCSSNLQKEGFLQRREGTWGAWLLACMQFNFFGDGGIICRMRSGGHVGCRLCRHEEVRIRYVLLNDGFFPRCVHTYTQCSRDMLRFGFKSGNMTVIFKVMPKSTR